MDQVFGYFVPSMSILTMGCACVFTALLYSIFGVAIEKARGAEDDINTMAAGTLTGMLFKSTGVWPVCG